MTIAGAALAQESGPAPEPDAAPSPDEMSQAPTPLLPDDKGNSKDIQTAAPDDGAESEAQPGTDRAGLGREIEKLLKSFKDQSQEGSDEAQDRQSREINERLAKLLERMEALDKREAALKQAAVATADDAAGGGRDPFGMTERLKRVSTGGAEGVQFVPSPGLPGTGEVPQMRLRGILRMGSRAQGSGGGEGEGTVAAILEVAGAGTHIVREGDTVGLQRLGSSAVVKVLRVDRLSMVVEVGSLGQVIIVR